MEEKTWLQSSFFKYPTARSYMELLYGIGEELRRERNLRYRLRWNVTVDLYEVGIQVYHFVDGDSENSEEVMNPEVLDEINEYMRKMGYYAYFDNGEWEEDEE